MESDTVPSSYPRGDNAVHPVENEGATMPNDRAIEFPPAPEAPDVECNDVLTPRFDGNGLVTAVVVDATSKDVLMLAHMNREALALTLTTREAHFWSRSRRKLWKKGEDSGNVLTVRDVFTDCDQDALLVVVDVAGAGRACHTGEKSCFYRKVAAPSADHTVRLERV